MTLSRKVFVRVCCCLEEERRICWRSASLPGAATFPCADHCRRRGAGSGHVYRQHLLDDCCQGADMGTLSTALCKAVPALVTAFTERQLPTTMRRVTFRQIPCVFFPRRRQRRCIEREFTTSAPYGEIRSGAWATGASTPPPNTAEEAPPPALPPPLVGAGSLALPASAALLLSSTRKSCRGQVGRGRPR